MNKSKKTLELLIKAINILGVICLIYFIIPYVTHNTTIKNPDAMLPTEAWSAAGMAMTIGLIPLLVVNILGFYIVGTQKRQMKILWFIPSVLCFLLVVNYWFLSL